METGQGAERELKATSTTSLQPWAEAEASAAEGLVGPRPEQVGAVKWGFQMGKS